MPKHHSRRRKHPRTHKKRGGNGGATNYVFNAVGTPNQQFDRTFSTNGDYGNSANGNQLIGAKGENSQLVKAPSGDNLKLIQSAGRRRHRHKHNKTNKRGGFWGHIVNQAIVPFGLFGLQQSYKKK